ncbi:MAG: hypothetical protein JJ908_15825 [Rhizobiales bacterium]|nr:hypothetical protein [Hyphomicrobiales bacterium]MBO6699995.1 hypothetical protein [Hyphomicrobiales bacterium]MBO6737840.1 hypothetical protein [Hyphomicrobiales bacterium]MBO6913103.1 hypothetical protein [Hyphomicrobiales bacterium]MBO6957083.1 hypothetical protein [Hyphomicrobiales bacterium]
MADQPPALPSGTVEGRVSFTLVFLRSLLCLFAFLVAVLAAGLVGTFALYRGLEGDEAYEAFYWGTAILAVFAIAHTAFLPSVIVVLATEVFRLRSMVIFGVAGGLVGLYSATFALGSQVYLADRRVLIAAAVGIVGGFVYWLIAGRTAGAYRERRYSIPASVNAPGSPEA